jgi:ABC-2 type transport system ATP-binding protein
MSDTVSIIRLQHVTKEFGKTKALDRVSFTVTRGEVVGFAGANGAGKTTTISTMLGFINATSGTAELFGEEVRPSVAHKYHARIGYAAGDMGLPGRLTGAQYLSFVMHQMPGDHTKRYSELCLRFKPQLDKKISQLSRGNKQKIALIAAFVADPDLLVLDEPTSGLDPVMQEVFLDLVRAAQAAGKTVFMSSHYLNEVADVCSRVILMRNGAVIEDISASELFAKSGKFVRIVTGYKATRPPKDVSDVTVETKDGLTVLSFIFKGEVTEIQRWIASVKQLRDVEVSEYNLEGAFKSMYETEERPV